jgi:hypothetical protein
MLLLLLLLMLMLLLMLFAVAAVVAAVVVAVAVVLCYCVQFVLWCMGCMSCLYMEFWCERNFDKPVFCVPTVGNAVVSWLMLLLTMLPLAMLLWLDLSLLWGVVET